MASTCGSARGLLEERLHARRERLVGVVQQDVAARDRREDVGRPFGSRRLAARRPSSARARVVQRRAGRCLARSNRPPQVERAGQAVDLLLGDVELAASSRSSVTSSMSSVISRRIGGPKRRRSSSFSSAWMRFSVSSSSTSTSSLRVTRNAWWSRISMPGKRSSRWLAMRSSSGMKRSGRAVVRQLHEARQHLRHLEARELLTLPVFGLRTRIDEVERQARDVGERVRRVDRERHQHREDLGVEDRRRAALAVGRRRGRSQRHDVDAGLVERRLHEVAEGARRAGPAARAPSAQMSASTSCGARPTFVGTASPVTMRRLRPATRTMKNSSRLLAKIARKLARSSSGQRRVLGELEHALVEREPAELAVEDSGRRAAARRTPRTGRSRRRRAVAAIRRRSDLVARSSPHHCRAQVTSV